MTLCPDAVSQQARFVLAKEPIVVNLTFLVTLGISKLEKEVFFNMGSLNDEMGIILQKSSVIRDYLVRGRISGCHL